MHLVFITLQIFQTRTQGEFSEIQTILFNIELFHLLLLLWIDGFEHDGIESLCDYRIFELELETVLFYVLRLCIHSEHA